MRFSVRGLIITAAAIVFAGAATASAQVTDSITNVPFAFTVGKTTLPGGSYRISRLSGQMAAFEISSTTRSAIVIGLPDRPDRKDDNPRLVFHRYGDSYFLHEIVLPGDVAMSLPASRLEQDAAKKLAGNTVPEVVVVATRR